MAQGNRGNFDRNRNAQLDALAEAERAAEDNRILNAAYDRLRDAGLSPQSAQGLMNAMTYLPGVGEGVSVEDAANAWGAGKYGEAAGHSALALLGLVPFVGDTAARMGRNALRRVAGKAPIERTFHGTGDVARLQREGIQPSPVELGPNTHRGHGFYTSAEKKRAMEYARRKQSDAARRLSNAPDPGIVQVDVDPTRYLRTRPDAPAPVNMDEQMLAALRAAQRERAVRKAQGNKRERRAVGRAFDREATTILPDTGEDLWAQGRVKQGRLHPDVTRALHAQGYTGGNAPTYLQNGRRQTDYVIFDPRTAKVRSRRFSPGGTPLPQARDFARYLPVPVVRGLFNEIEKSEK